MQRHLRLHIEIVRGRGEWKRLEKLLKIVFMRFGIRYVEEGGYAWGTK